VAGRLRESWITSGPLAETIEDANCLPTTLESRTGPMATPLETGTGPTAPYFGDSDGADDHSPWRL
jgi:hypothetical protein